MNKKIHYGSKNKLIIGNTENQKPTDIALLAAKMKEVDPDGKKAMKLAKKYQSPKEALFKSIAC